MKELQPGDFPLDKSKPFGPTAVYYVRKLGSPSLYSVYDLSTTIPPIKSLEEAADEAAKRPPIFKIQQRFRFSRTFSGFDSAGVRIADISGPLLSFGHWKLTFSISTPLFGHDIELRPVGVGSREDVFVLDSVPYFWDPEGTVRHLYKAMDDTRVEVARFTSKHPRDMSGMLVVDDREVRLAVVLMTSVALLKRSDSFRK